MMKKSAGYFVISLDFELIWGVFDVLDYKHHLPYFQNTRKIIPEILQCFRDNEINCTWATVGMLFNSNWVEWVANTPETEPAYQDSRLSAYMFGNCVPEEESNDVFFAPEIIQKIIETPGQEIGTHTYSHYYCQEEGQTVEQFREDLEMAIRLAQRQNIKLESLVFPRNQFAEEYLKVCFALGIQAVRSNPNDWYWKNPKSESLLTKIARTGDAYNVFARRKSYSLKEMKPLEGLPLSQMASRFLRPVENNSLLRRLKMRRIKDEMTAAAKKGEVYHLWWHPHNFGHYPKESLQDLGEIISHFKTLQKKYNFQSKNMKELRDFVIKKT